MHSSVKTSSVVVADDHPLILKGLKALLDAEPDFHVVAACEDGLEALVAIRQHIPDIAILDIAMPKLSGLDVLTRIDEEGLCSKIIFLTATVCDRYVLCSASPVAPTLVRRKMHQTQ